MAADAGWEVRAIGSTATERGIKADAASWLGSIGLDVRARPPSGRRGRELSFAQRGIPYTLLDTGDLAVREWRREHGRAYDELFDAEISAHRPDVLLTYGGREGDLARRERARRAGCGIAFCVFNSSYRERAFFDGVDAVLTPSEWLARRYRDEIGLESTPLPTPIDPEDVLATDREPIFVTMVNPSVEKGLFFFARLAEEIGRRAPEVAVLVIEARGTAGMLAAAGEAGGFDLRRHESIMFAPATARPREIFQPARLLLVPSVWDEPSGRVVAEALVNGVPPLVSDRGGLAESCNGAGKVLPLPRELTLETRVPVSAGAVEPWLEAVVRLCSDEALYAAASARALEAAALYRRETLAPRYVAFFESVLRRAPRG